MKVIFSVSIFLATLGTCSVFASDCAYVNEPLTSDGIAAQFRSITGVYEDSGARELVVDGKKVFGKIAVVISREGVQMGYTIYPSLFAPYTQIQVITEYTATSGRISSPIAALNGSIILETEQNGICTSIAINPRGDTLCQSPVVSHNNPSNDLSSLERCIILKKLK